ncbi:hypothetical protein PS914_05699 [Pseudomonas fluorescens]|uniref:tyrosine-type recombinase/integrase n=1 Tax=Pseudomonas fluorescens TaxID=294 RepID=UPI001240D32B|nr:tyrosine-type recombinase/integrase [Pseudomonas fluorescens]VVQ15179.1 hypothetical protein PS914_05699 [Pseudomonas fluorescens]
MRFPIYTFDLAPKRRFKRIANVLWRNWPIANDISLMTAQEILAQGLGYCDFHDVSKSSKNCSPDAPVPTLSEVRDNVSTSIFQYLKSSNTEGIDDRDIERLVLRLPLHELLAFHSLRQEQMANVDKTDSHSRAVCSDQKTREATQGLHPKALNSTGNVSWSSASHLANRKFLSGRELDTIAEVVCRKGTLRDRVLCSVLTSGIRQYELLNLKVENVSYTNHMVMLDLPSTRLHTNQQRRLLNKTDGLLASTYIKQSGFSYGDYLFPSSKATGHPMTPTELNKILRSWLLEAQIDSKGVSTHSMRLSVIARFIQYLADSKQSSVSHFGHSAPEISPYFVSSRNKKPNE